MHSCSLNTLLGSGLLIPGLAAANIGDIPRTDRSINIDGAMNEEAWRDAARIDINIETRPRENIAAKVGTVAYLIEDGDSLYVAQLDVNNQFALLFPKTRPFFLTVRRRLTQLRRWRRPSLENHGQPIGPVPASADG